MVEQPACSNAIDAAPNRNARRLPIKPKLLVINCFLIAENCAWPHQPERKHIVVLHFNPKFLQGKREARVQWSPSECAGASCSALRTRQSSTLRH